MTLWAFIVPGVLMFFTAIAAHCCRDSYWPAARLTFIMSAAWLCPYFVALHVIFFNDMAFEWTDLFRFALIAIGGGVAGVVLSMLIGLIFITDRRLAPPEDVQ